MGTRKKSPERQEGPEGCTPGKKIHCKTHICLLNPQFGNPLVRKKKKKRGGAKTDAGRPWGEETPGRKQTPVKNKKGTVGMPPSNYYGTAYYLVQGVEQYRGPASINLTHKADHSVWGGRLKGKMCIGLGKEPSNLLGGQRVGGGGYKKKKNKKKKKKGWPATGKNRRTGLSSRLGRKNAEGN